MRLIFGAIIILLTISACALGDDTASEIELTVIPIEETDESFDAASIPVNESTEELQPTVTSTATATQLVPQATRTPAPQSIRNTENCTVRTDLPTYTIISGDTLSSIATRFDTTTAQLSEYNCLTNANVITTGMQLYVPYIPPTPTPLPTDAPVVQVSSTPSDLGIRGTLRVYPAIESGNVSDWNDYVIEPETPFTVDWTGIEPEYYYDIVAVTFVYTGDDGTVIHIGVDNDISDGMAVTWTPPAGVSGSITGSARTENNGFWRSSTLHIREPEETSNNQEEGCQFTLFETADAYENSHSRTTVVATDVSAGLTFSIIDLTVVDIGTFVKVEVSNGVEGWISGAHGSVICPGE